jgi:hypothetical protein
MVKFKKNMAMANVGSGLNWVTTQISPLGVLIGEVHNPTTGAEGYNTIMLIVTYFPPEVTSTKEEVRALDRFIKGWDLLMFSPHVPNRGP